MVHVQRIFFVVFLAGTLLGLNWLTGSNSSDERLDASERLELNREIASLKKEVEALQEELGILRHRTKSSEKRSQPIQSTTLSWDKDAKDDPFLGKIDAPILLVSFSDYQCGPCRKFFADTLPQIKKRYIDTGKLKFVFRDFPLSKHKFAPTAAAIAHCAGEQGQYWKMHDALFSNADKVDIGNFPDIYYELKKIDSVKLERCVESQRYGKEIVSDAQAGKRLGAKGAPGFFIGTKVSDDTFSGALIRGAQPFAVFEAYISQLTESEKDGKDS